MLAMVTFGVGEILGCFLTGYIVDRFGSKVAVIANLLIIVATTLETLGFIYVYNFNWMAFVMTFLWGMQDSMINTHTQQILGFEFDNNSEPFSLFNTLQCVTCFIFQLIEAEVDNREGYFIYTAIVGVISFLCCVLPYFFTYRTTVKKEVSAAKLD
jgi:predicted MFS family arabinose efflux permease